MASPARRRIYSTLVRSTPDSVEPDALERHYTAEEIARTWSLSTTYIRQIFQEENGVFKIGKSNRRDGKRDYMTLRIPESVMRRVHRERTR